MRRTQILSRLMILFLFVPKSLFAMDLQCRILPELFKMFAKEHYLFHEVSPELQKRSVERFIKILDPSKTLYNAADVASIRARVLTVFDTMKKGECKPLEDAYDLAVQRSKENEEFIRGFIKNNYVFDKNATLVLDPEKRDFFKTKEERENFLKNQVHFSVSNYLLSDMKLEDAKNKVIHRYELISKRIQEDRTKEVLNHFAEGFASGLDPHSSFMSSSEMENFKIELQLSLEGIGATLTSDDGFTVIEDLVPGGGAEKSGKLKTKDKIIAVSQEGQEPVNVIDMDLNNVVKQIRGKKGTKVTLTILRQAEKSETFNVTITRDKIDLKERAAKITYEKKKIGNKEYKIGLIDFPSFYGGGGKGSRSSYEDIRDLLVEANKKKVDGIVLDISRNGGGLLDHAVKISGLFIREGGIVGTQDTAQKVEVLEDDDADVVYSGPLMVLTSKLSASASEILAGALKDYNRALIVGREHTFGKGSIQKPEPLLFNLGTMKVTIGMFFTPGGFSTQHQGVTSDLILPPTFYDTDIGENKMDYSMPPKKIEAFSAPKANYDSGPKRWTPIDRGLVPALTSRSQERIKKDTKYQEALALVEESKKNDGVIKLAELTAREEKEKKKNGGKVDKRKKQKPEDNPFVQESVNVMADWLALIENPKLINQSVLANSTALGEVKSPTDESKKTAVGNP